jgi:hypothetical protein
LVREALSGHNLTAVFPENPVVWSFRRLKNKITFHTLNRNCCKDSKATTLARDELVGSQENVVSRQK